MLEFFEALIEYIRLDGPLISAILAGVIIEIVSRRIKSRMKRSIFSQYENSIDPEHAEYYLSYYRKIQAVDIIRALSVLVVIFIILTFKSGGSLNFLLVGIGALIITLKDFILSIIAFFFILRQYKIGDTIGIGDMQGQVIYIRVFSIGILGKDNDGDSTGKLYIVPGHKLITESIKKEDLHINSIKKEILRIPFKANEFEMSFEEFIEGLEKYLSELLPTLSKKNCGNFQTYIGYKYKLDIDYLEDKCVLVTVGLVGKWESIVKNKTKIVNFIESQRKKEKKKEE